jgi:hypothetical protein
MLAKSRCDARAAVRVALVLVGATAALASAAATAHARADKPRIAVLWIAADKVAPDVRGKLEAAVVGGLAASGADVVDSAETARRIADKGLAGCETSTCLAGIGQAVGARYLVRGNIDAAGGRYDVRLEMIDGASGAVIEMRADRCEICTEVEAYETASVAASALKAQVSKRQATLAAAGAPPAPAPSGDAAAAELKLAAPAPAPGVGAAPTVAAAKEAGPTAARRSRVLPIIGVGAGVVAAAAGAYLVALDGKGTCTTTAPDQLCEFQYRTKPGGVTLIGAGALVAVASAAFLVWRF